MTLTRFASPAMLPDARTLAQRQRSHGNRPETTDRVLKPLFHFLGLIHSGHAHRCSMAHIHFEGNMFLQCSLKLSVLRACRRREVRWRGLLLDHITDCGVALQPALVHPG